MELNIQSPRCFQLWDSMIPWQYQGFRSFPLSRFLGYLLLLYHLAITLLCNVFFLACLSSHTINHSAGSPMPDVENKVRSNTSHPPPSPTLLLLSWGYSPAGKRDINQQTFPLSVWLQSGISTLNRRECGQSDPDPQLKISLSKWHVKWDSRLTGDGWSKIWKWVSLILDVSPSPKPHIPQLGLILFSHCTHCSGNSLYETSLLQPPSLTCSH